MRPTSEDWKFWGACHCCSWAVLWKNIAPNIHPWSGSQLKLLAAGQWMTSGSSFQCNWFNDGSRGRLHLAEVQSKWMNGRGIPSDRERDLGNLLLDSWLLSMKVKKSQNSYHIARRVGYQGTRCPVGNRAGTDKYTTGKHTMNLRSRFRIGTWNVRKLKELGKLSTICSEMDRNNIEILGIVETNWINNGNFKTHETKTIVYSGKDEGTGYSHGVASILSKESAKSLIGYNPISDRLIKLRIQAKPHNISLIMCYAPTSVGSEEDLEDFYNSLQQAIDSTPNRDITIIMGDFNAKVGKQLNNSDCIGMFGLGDQNERGENLIEFCRTNNLVIANTLFKHHSRNLYTWTAPDRKTRNQIDYVLINQKWKGSLRNVKTRPGANCNSDHQLLVIDLKLKLKKIQTHPHHYDSTSQQWMKITGSKLPTDLQLCLNIKMTRHQMSCGKKARKFFSPLQRTTLQEGRKRTTLGYQRKHS